MVFQLARTYADPGPGPGSQRGYPAPGAGAQTTGPWSPEPHPIPREPVRPTKGRRSWFRPSDPDGGQRGTPPSLNAAQRRPAGSMDANPPPFPAEPIYVYTPYFSRGTAAYVPNLGKVLTNPIGAGVVALHRPQASYGGAAQYENGALWWTSQAIPTTIAPQSLTDPDQLAAILGSLQVQAVVRTTG